MKLSEAIRVGSKLHPQGFGDTRVTVHKHNWWCRLGLGKCEPIVTTCALGAAFEAGDCGSHEETAKNSGRAFRGVIAEGQKYTVIEMPTDWINTLYLEADCPQCERREPLKVLIPHLNDDHKWTREEIALLVERVEAAQLPQVAQATVEASEDEEWPSVISEHAPTTTGEVR